MAIVATLCVCLSVMLITPLAATHFQKEQSSHQQGNIQVNDLSAFVLLSQIIMIMFLILSCHHEQLPMTKSSSLSLHCPGNSGSLIRRYVKSYAAQGLTSLNKPKGDSTSGKPYHREQNEVYGRRPAGKWRGWVKGTDTYHFFNMDYAPVRRRPPIHNKSLPAGP
ncbi:hypothetical protein SADUNF_Sadunf08G0090300 [Salix dunnii]|uniref:Uncharacterized protein n=1 Tax=Salix dunnii TaxID=1413687 RepID=A0A835JY21_9ROSI|nr:hypothetical protein SADUNF_Sadunf08G0090300 [Salix dunnii]